MRPIKYNPHIYKYQLTEYRVIYRIRDTGVIGKSYHWDTGPYGARYQMRRKAEYAGVKVDILGVQCFTHLTRNGTYEKPANAHFVA